MKKKYLIISSVLILSACGNDDSNVEGDQNKVVPNTVSSLIFKSPINKNAYMLNDIVLIDLSHLASTDGKVEIFINGGDILELNSPYIYSWKANKIGKKELHAKFFSSENKLVSEGIIEIVVVSDVSETTQLLTNVGRISDIKIGDTLTLTATPKGNTPLSKVAFLFNNEIVKTFTQEPYVFDWTPTTFQKKDFTINAISSDPAIPVLAPKLSYIRSFSEEAITYCNNIAKTWERSTQYDAGAYVKYKNYYFIASKSTMQEPSFENTVFNHWSNISCDNITQLTAPFVYVTPPGGRFNDGDNIRIGVSINPQEDSQASIVEVTAFRLGEEIQTLSNDLDQTYIHKIKVDPSTGQDTFQITAKNSLNQSHTVEASLLGNTPPIHQLDIRQNGYSEGSYSSAKSILLFSTVRDNENKVDYVEFYINGKTQGQIRPQIPGRPFEDSNIFLPVDLSVGEYRITAKAVDNDGGITNVEKIIVVK